MTFETRKVANVKMMLLGQAYNKKKPYTFIQIRTYKFTYEVI